MKAGSARGQGNIGAETLPALLALITEDERRTLAHCAVVRLFDAQLFDTHLRAGRTQLAELLARGWVETSGGDRRLCWIAPDLRADAWNTWWSDVPEDSVAPPPELASLSATLADYFARAIDWPIERLRQLAIADPGAARRQFEHLVRAADQRFDLAYCQDVVEALSEPDRSRFLPQDLRDLRERWRRRIAARSMWASEFYRTRRALYQPRDAVQKDLARLLATGPDSRWLFQLHGLGGSGKSTVLNWFIARQCVADERITPCARINCDTLDPVAVLERPWLVLIEAAEQLDPQLPDAPFLGMLNGFGRYRGRLRRAPAAARAAVADRERVAHVAEEAQTSFCAALAGGPPVLIVLDGLDEIATRSQDAPAQLRGLIGLLFRVHESVPAVRVILAGRTDLVKLVPRLGARPDQVINAEMPRFDPAEATEYLYRREVTDPGKVTAVIRKSQGLPMVVALYADLIRQENLSADDIAEQTLPQVEYLITRILAHISDLLVRSALLYSVIVQAELTFEFFRDVMLKLWRAQAAADGIPDELAPASPRRNAEVPGPDDDAAMARLWKRIVTEASKATWISAKPANGGPELIVVHSDVRNALRTEVSGHRTFQNLHAQAAAHYQALIESGQRDEPGDHWVGWMKAVIYHRFRERGGGAISYWREALARARELGRLDWAQELASYVLHADFQDDAGKPDLTVLACQAPYEAHVELARLAAENAGRLPARAVAVTASGLWLDDVERELTQARHARERAQEAQSPLRPADYEVIVRAMRQVELGTGPAADAALADLDRLDSSAPAALGDAWLVRARASAAREPAASFPELPESALSAYEASCEAYEDQESVAYVAMDAARWLLRVDRPDLALDWCDRADAACPDARRPDGALAEVRAETLLALGRPGSAVAALEGPAARPRSVRARCLAAEAQLRLRRPAEAVRELTGEAPGVPGGAEEHAVEGRIDRELLLARAYGELLDVANAEDCFRAAQDLICKADEEYQARINARRALFKLRVEGSIRQAEVELAPEFGMLTPGRPAWTSLRLARAELAGRQRRGADMVRLLDEVRGQREAGAGSARWRVRASLAGLAASAVLDPPSRAGYLANLADDLESVAPPARLAMLAELAECQPVAASPPLAGRVRRIIAGDDLPDKPAPHDVDQELDRAWRKLITSRLLRIIGDHREAARLRADVLWTLRGDPFIRWDVLLTEGSSAVPPASPAGQRAPEMPPDPYYFNEHYSGYPLLLAAFITELADKYDQDRRGYEVGRWLQHAQTLLGAPSLARTGWLARFHEVMAEREDTLTGRTSARREKANKIWADLGDELHGPGVAQALPEPAADVHRDAVAELLVSASGNDPTVRFSQRRRAGGREVPGLPVPDSIADNDLGIRMSALSWGHAAGAQVRHEVQPLLAEAGRRGVDVRVSIPNPGRAAPPWELVHAGGSPLAAHDAVRFVFRTSGGALRRRHEVLCLQRALRLLGIGAGRIDGIDGPVFRRALARFHTRHGLAAEPAVPGLDTWRAVRQALRELAGPRASLRVHVIQPMSGGSLGQARRFGDRMTELTRTYQAAFTSQAEPVTPALRLEITSGDEVAGLFAGSPRASARCDVLHVCTVMEATEQMPVVGLDTKNGPPLTAPELDLLVRRVSRGVPPLVVLDVQAPPSPVEVRRQLLMRNRFAHQLLALGSVTTIIATGLASRDMLVTQWQSLAKGLAACGSAAEICREIQRHPGPAGPDSTEDADAHAVAFPATALFTCVPPDRLIEPGLISRASGLVGV